MLVDKYIRYIKEERRFSQNTVCAYSKDLEQFSGYLRDQFDITSLSDAGFTHIRSWLVDLLNSGDTNRTINRKLSTLKSFYRFCLANGFIQINPSAKVSGPRTSKTLPVFIEEKKMESLLEVESLSTFEQIRDFFIIHLLYVTGMRRSELLQLKFENVNTETLTVNITGKRNKERIVPISLPTVEIFKHYLEFRNEIDSISGNEAYLFITAKGKLLNPRVLYRIIHEKLNEVSAQKRLGPHSLRHTFATHMLDDGADLNAIKEILGHSSLAATQVYTHNTVEKLKKIYKQAHPRA